MGGGLDNSSTNELEFRLEDIVEDERPHPTLPGPGPTAFFWLRGFRYESCMAEADGNLMGRTE